MTADPIMEDALASVESVGRGIDQLKAENAALAQIIKDAQAILGAYLPPDGISAGEMINRLLTLLDGPETRAAMAKLSPSTTTGE